MSRTCVIGVKQVEESPPVNVMESGQLYTSAPAVSIGTKRNINGPITPCSKSIQFCFIEEIVQWWSMRKFLWKHKNLTNIFVSKIILRKFSSYLRDAPDIYRFPSGHMVKTHFLLENLGISEPSLGKAKKFQCRSAFPNIRYKYTVLSLRQMY